MTASAIDALRAVRERLAAGQSLRQSVVGAGERSGSPLEGVVRELRRGAVLPEALRRAALEGGEPELRAALVVLAVQAEAGGDPGPAVVALEDRLRRRAFELGELRALTTQARLSARAMLLLTPGFMALLALLDPPAVTAALRQPAARAAVAVGVAMQLAGAWWIGRIVAACAGGVSGSRMRRLPVLRAVVALVAGRVDPARQMAAEVAEAADLTALLLSAGASGQRAIELAAPILSGTFGDALRQAVAEARSGRGLLEALQDAVRDLPSRQPGRFVGALEASRRFGVPAARTLRDLADEIRSEEAAKRTEEVRGASVRVLLPLALLVLPAFILACLVPLFLGGLEGLDL